MDNIVEETIADDSLKIIEITQTVSRTEKLSLFSLKNQISDIDEQIAYLETVRVVLVDKYNKAILDNDLKVDAVAQKFDSF